MHVALEYITLGFIAVTLVVSTLWSMQALVQGVRVVESEQLYTVAERLVDKILLTPGKPVNWGSDLTLEGENITDFGLALAGVREPYLVDPDKVMRLVNYTWFENPAYLDPRRVAELLRLEEGYSRYGFILEISPLYTLNATPVSWDSETGIAESFRVKAVNYEGREVANVNVTGLLVVLYSEEGCGVGGSERVNVGYAVLKDSCITGIRGVCSLDYSDELEDVKPLLPRNYNQVAYVLILYGNWHGFAATSHYSPGDSALDVYLIGVYVIAEYSVENPPYGAILLKDEALEALPDYSKLVEIQKVTVECVGDDPSDWTPACRVLNKGAKRYQLYRLEYVERLASHVILVGCRRGRLFAYVASKYPVETFRYGLLEEVSAANLVTMTRLVHMMGYSYVVRLYLWRWEE